MDHLQLWADRGRRNPAEVVGNFVWFRADRFGYVLGPNLDAVVPVELFDRLDKRFIKTVTGGVVAVYGSRREALADLEQVMVDLGVPVKTLSL